MSDTGTGTTIAFGTTGFTGHMLSFSPSGRERGEYETTHMGTTGSKTWAPMKLIDEGSLDIEFNFDPDEKPPMDQPSETITITFPIPAGGSTGATMVGSGFLTGDSWSSELEEKMVGGATLRWAGPVTWTAST
jgi:hypothetical protein